jgi:hypothetical protein
VEEIICKGRQQVIMVCNSGICPARNIPHLQHSTAQHKQFKMQQEDKLLAVALADPYAAQQA